MILSSEEQKSVMEEIRRKSERAADIGLGLIPDRYLPTIAAAVMRDPDKGNVLSMMAMLGAMAEELNRLRAERN